MLFLGAIIGLAVSLYEFRVFEIVNLMGDSPISAESCRRQRSGGG